MLQQQQPSAPESAPIIIPCPHLLPSLVDHLAKVAAELDPLPDAFDLENKSQKRAMMEKSSAVITRFNDFPRGYLDVFVYSIPTLKLYTCVKKRSSGLVSRPVRLN